MSGVSKGHCEAFTPLKPHNEKERLHIMTKWCIIGAGGIADRRVIPALLKDKSNVLVGIMERVESVARELEEKYGVPAFCDEREMLDKVDCDAVYIGTPVFRHKSQALLALSYGKHVFIEKPMAMDAVEAEQMLDAFKSAGKQLTVGYMMKYHDLHARAREMISRGDIGKVNDVRVQLGCWYPEIEGAWRQTRALSGGGAVMDLGVHCIDTAEFLLSDEITDVKAYLSNSTFSYEVEDSAVILFRTRGGTLGHIDVNFNIPDAAAVSKLELYGTAGNIILEGTLSQVESGRMTCISAPQGDYDAAQDRSVSEPCVYYPEGEDIYLRQLKHFCSIIAEGKTDYAYTEDAVHVQRLVDRIYGEA